MLLLDIGNTETAIAVHSGGSVRRYRLPTDPRATPDLLRAIASHLLDAAPDPLAPARIASVVPPLTAAWHAYLSEAGWAPRVVTPSEVPIPLDGPRPEEVGIDRLLASWGARERLGAPVIVCDFGTASTFDAVGPDGAYLGGAIAPGLEIGSEALARRTARLLRVDLAEPTPPDTAPWGATTRDALRAGLLQGHAAMAEGMIVRFRARLGPKTPVAGTGGYAPRLSSLLSTEGVTLLPHLVLDALGELP